MRARLELLGYDLTDDEGNCRSGIMAELAAHVEKHYGTNIKNSIV